MNIYYVYQYLREDMTPYYIGKGSKGRAYKSQRAIPKPKDKNRIQIIAHKLSRFHGDKCKKNLGVDPTQIIKQDKKYVKEYLGL